MLGSCFSPRRALLYRDRSCRKTNRCAQCVEPRFEPPDAIFNVVDTRPLAVMALLLQSFRDFPRAHRARNSRMRWARAWRLAFSLLRTWSMSERLDIADFRISACRRLESSAADLARKVV